MKTIYLVAVALLISACQIQIELPEDFFQPAPIQGQAPTAIVQYEVSAEHVVFDATSSFDEQGDPLYFQWFVNGEFVSDQIFFEQDLMAGTYDVFLIVSDGLNEDTSQTMISVPAAQAEAPDAELFVNQTPYAHFYLSLFEDSLFVDALNSKDADGDELTYEWYINGKLVHTQAAVQLMFADIDLLEGENIITLVVSDGFVSDSVAQIINY